MKKTLFLTSLLLAASTSYANDVEIVKAIAKKSANNTYSFNVTLKHADTGWEHFANQWQILSTEGKVLGTRTLYHPHVEEQPFTRALGRVKVPAGATHVIIKARDSVHGVSAQEYKVELP